MIAAGNAADQPAIPRKTGRAMSHLFAGRETVASAVRASAWFWRPSPLSPCCPVWSWPPGVSPLSPLCPVAPPAGRRCLGPSCPAAQTPPWPPTLPDRARPSSWWFPRRLILRIRDPSVAAHVREPLALTVVQAEPGPRRRGHRVAPQGLHELAVLMPGGRRRQPRFRAFADHVQRACARALDVARGTAGPPAADCAATKRAARAATRA